MIVLFLYRQSATDVVVLRGWYTKLTVCLYGYFTSIQEVPATVPAVETQQNSPAEEKAGPAVDEPQGMEFGPSVLLLLSVHNSTQLS